MPQVPKASVRDRLLDAARTAFALHGYRAASVGAIARDAGLSTGNVYRYFPNKAALFEAAVPDDFVADFEARLRSRVDGLIGLDDPADLSEAAQAGQRDFSSFLIAHRREVAILLGGSVGTPRAGFAPAFVAELTDRTRAHLEAQRGRPLSAEALLVLTQVFEGARLAFVAILTGAGDAGSVARAFTHFWSFQLAGLAGFRREVLS